ncbi:MAG: hypothetical protein GC160_20510 [Acidobacteria bacterium]|nr:hypothetical protein [Acidobacteriota bacterium]
MLPRRVAVFLFLALPLAAAQGDRARGWEIYQQARAAAAHGKTLADYSFERVTQLEREGRTLRITSRTQAIPGKAQRIEVESQAGVVTMVVNGDQGWRSGMGAKQNLPPDAVALQRKEDARTAALYGPAVEEGSVRFREETSVNGRPADVIELDDVGDTPLRLYVDRETHDVLERVFVGDAPGGKMAQIEEFLSDYRDVNGFRWPFAKRVVRNGEEANSSTLSNVQLNQGLTVQQLTQ